MTMQVHDHGLQQGLGALLLSLDQGLGIAGPYGANPTSKVDAGAYEISGTEVALRATPGGTETGRFNNAYGANGNKVVPPPDQVDFDGQTGTAQGRTWASVTVKSGQLQGSKGYVAIEFLAPVGWTASHNGTGPPQGGGGGGGTDITKVTETTSTTTISDYTPYILAGAGGVGLLIIGWALLSKPKAGGGARRRSGRRRRTGRRRSRR